MNALSVSLTCRPTSSRAFADTRRRSLLLAATGSAAPYCHLRYRLFVCQRALGCWLLSSLRYLVLLLTVGIFRPRSWSSLSFLVAYARARTLNACARLLSNLFHRAPILVARHLTALCNPRSAVETKAALPPWSIGNIASAGKRNGRARPSGAGNPAAARAVALPFCLLNLGRFSQTAPALPLRSGGGAVLAAGVVGLQRSEGRGSSRTSCWRRAPLERLAARLAGLGSIIPLGSLLTRSGRSAMSINPCRASYRTVIRSAACPGQAFAFQAIPDRFCRSFPSVARARTVELPASAGFVSTVSSSILTVLTDYNVVSTPKVSREAF